MAKAGSIPRSMQEEMAKENEDRLAGKEVNITKPKVVTFHEDTIFPKKEYEAKQVQRNKRQQMTLSLEEKNRHLKRASMSESLDCMMTESREAMLEFQKEDAEPKM